MWLVPCSAAKRSIFSDHSRLQNSGRHALCLTRSSKAMLICPWCLSACDDRPQQQQWDKRRPCRRQNWQNTPFSMVPHQSRGVLSQCTELLCLSCRAQPLQTPHASPQTSVWSQARLLSSSASCASCSCSPHVQGTLNCHPHQKGAS